MPLQKAQKARMGSTAAVTGTRLATADHSMLSHKQQSATQRGYGQRQNAAPISSFRNAPVHEHTSQLDAHIIDLSSSANFRSLDHSTTALAKTDCNLSTVVGQGPPVPPLELKFSSNAKEDYGTRAHSEYTAGLKENPVVLSQQRQPSESRDPGKTMPALSTADEYYKYHKKLRNNKSQLKDERRKSSQVQLQRIEGVVSPISCHKQRGLAGDMQRHESIHSAQMELKPPSHQHLHRKNSANSSSLQPQRLLQNQFQTVEVHGAGGRLPSSKKAGAQRPNLPRHANPKTQRREHNVDGDAYDSHRDMSHQHQDDSDEPSKQTITFRKDRLAQRGGDHDASRHPVGYLDSTHEASFDDLRQDDDQDDASQNQRQRRGAPKYHS